MLPDSYTPYHQIQEDTTHSPENPLRYIAAGGGNPPYQPVLKAYLWNRTVAL